MGEEEQMTDSDKLARRIMARIERDGCVHLSSLVTEIDEWKAIKRANTPVITVDATMLAPETVNNWFHAVMTDGRVAQASKWTDAEFAKIMKLDADRAAKAWNGKSK